MARIRFTSSRSEKVITVAANDGGRTLLSVAREHGVPILFNCECGDCGDCLVEVSTGASDAAPPLTEKEQDFLEVAGKLGVSPAGRREYRLACQCRVGDADIEVGYLGTLGSR